MGLDSSDRLHRSSPDVVSLLLLRLRFWIFVQNREFLCKWTGSGVICANLRADIDLCRHSLDEAQSALECALATADDIRTQLLSQETVDPAKITLIDAWISLMKFQERDYPSPLPEWDEVG
jgi:hypothetical protein